MDAPKLKPPIYLAGNYKRKHKNTIGYFPYSHHYWRFIFARDEQVAVYHPHIMTAPKVMFSILSFSRNVWEGNLFYHTTNGNMIEEVEPSHQ